MQKYKESLIIGIVGGSASGKTTLAHALFDHFKAFTTLITQDHYYKPKDQLTQDENGETNFDLPNAVHLEGLKKDLKDLLEGKKVIKEKYHFNNPNKSKEVEVWTPKPIILVEGMFAFEDEDLLNLYDHKIYVSSPRKEKLHRRLIRDEKERGYEKDYILYQWDNHVIPAHLNFVKKHKEIADFIWINTGAPLKYDQIIKWLSNKIKHIDHNEI